MKSLRALRREKGYTIKNLAKVCTTTHPHISRIERGLISPSQRTREYIENNIFDGEAINWIDTPHLITSPVYETEWTETVEQGWNKLVGTNTERIVSAINTQAVRGKGDLYCYGGGDSNSKIRAILNNL